MERRFKSEKEKIEYYKKLKVKENNIAQKNMDTITEAYHEVEFGVVPEIADNRSLAEKIADERGQQKMVQKNTLMLMSNDGGEAIRLQNLLGTRRYADFNRHFLEIFNMMQPQIGMVRAQEAYDTIDKYLIKMEQTDGVDIPNAEMLNQLTTLIQNIPASPTMNLPDVVLRLQALEHVLTQSANTLNRVEYNTRGLPSSQDVQDILTELQDMGNVITTGQRDNRRMITDATNAIRDAGNQVGDEVRNAGNQVGNEVRAVDTRLRNQGVGNSLRFNELMEQLIAMTEAIDADSLASVMSELTESTAYGDADEEDREDDDEPEFYDANDEIEEVADEAEIMNDGGNQFLVGDVAVQIIDPLLNYYEQTLGEAIDDKTETRIADIVQNTQTEYDIMDSVNDIMTVIKQKYDINDTMEDDMTIRTTESLREDFFRLKNLSRKQSWDNNERLQEYIEAYEYVVANINRPELEMTDQIKLNLKKNVLKLFLSAKINGSSLSHMKDIDKIQNQFTTNKPKLERLYNHVLKKKDKNTQQLTKEEVQMLNSFYSSVNIDDYGPEDDPIVDPLNVLKVKSDEIILAIDRLKKSAAKKGETTLKPNKTNPDFNDYVLLRKLQDKPGVDYNKMTAKKYSIIASELNRSPYQYIYAQLTSRFGRPQAEEEMKQDGDEKQGNGFKKWRRIMKKRVY